MSTPGALSADRAGAPTDPSAMWALIRAGISPTDDTVATVAAADVGVLGRGAVSKRTEALRSSVLGLGPLTGLANDPLVTDILVNGCAGVWVDLGEGLQSCPSPFVDDEDVRRFAVRLAALAGRRLDDSAPYVDGLLPGGVRLHALLPPLVDAGAHISLRIPRVTAPTLADLAGWGAMDATAVELLTAIVRARVSFLVSGGTGAGKSTLLAALLAAVPSDERVVLVEDVRELSVAHPHVVRLQSRSANVEGRGEIPMVVLVRQALRMRPDRLVVGEVRGAEIREMLAALNTGHDGGCATVHANSARDVVARCEALGALAGLPAAALHRQLSSAVSLVIHVRRSHARREVATISVVGSCGDGIDVDTAWSIDSTPGSEPGWAALADLLDTRLGRPS